jgi:hypothetical protein
MTYIYGNSLLFFLELCDPVYGYFHGLMLTTSLVIGWSLHFIFGFVMHKTIHKIYKIKGSKNLYIEYLGFYKVLSFNSESCRRRNRSTRISFSY